jgi:hypothetical protein
MKRVADHQRALNDYLQSEFASSARYNEESARYNYHEDGVLCEAGGLLSWLRATYYPHYVEGVAPSVKSRIKQGKPSNPLQGIRVDQELALVAQDAQTPTAHMHAMTLALLAHWQAKGHSVVAAQVPVRINEHRMTKADVLTQDGRTAKLWMWEVKTGMPAALCEKQDCLRGVLGSVPCTKQNQWQLQCEYTRRALLRAGLPIAGARVIQVYEERQSGDFTVKEHRSATWLKQIKN